MDSNANNHQKYENYRVQISRLTSSHKGRFYLEAIFNEYAIMEDRLKSVLRHAGKWHPKDGIFNIFDAKVKKVAELTEEKKTQLVDAFPSVNWSNHKLESEKN